jgi:hypothetical protein
MMEWRIHRFLCMRHFPLAINSADDASEGFCGQNHNHYHTENISWCAVWWPTSATGPGRLAGITTSSIAPS